jgi:tetratricopeptide (TPR) repeat protein
MMKSSLIRINLIFILLVLFIPNLTSAETKTFIKEYTYQASEYDSKVSCRALALEQVKRLLLEELGTYIESHTEVINFQLTKDQITALTAGIVQTQILKEKWDGERYWVQAKIEADPDKVAKDVDALRKDMQKSKDLEDIRKKADDLSREIERLRKELALSKKDEIKIARYDEAVKELSATDFVAKGISLVADKKNEEAIGAFTKAIQLDHKYARAFAFRGATYAELGNYKQAFDDVNKGMKLDPKDARNYAARGWIYSKSGNYQRSIEDFSKVIEMDPKLAAAACLQRATLYLSLGNAKQALDDVNKSIELDAKNPKSYILRGGLYLTSGNYQRSIEDFSESIKLDPKLAASYHIRAVAYAKLGNENQAMNDLKTAARLGFKESQDFLKSNGFSW